MRRARNFGINCAIVMLCVAFVVLMTVTPPPVTPDPVVVTVQPDDILDEPNHVVLAASFTPSLVQAGTVTPYSGNWAAGIVLRVSGVGAVVNWTIEAWANQTAPSPLQGCNVPGLHFAPEDWVGVADTAGSGDIIYTTTAITSPSRMGPDGDHCSARVAAFGVWHVHARIDHRPGGPLGKYDLVRADGSVERRIDTWDREIDVDFQVPA